MPASAGRTSSNTTTPLYANLLGPFSMSRGNDSAGPWPRPGARRLCQMILVSPGRRISREAAREALFPHLDLPAGTGPYQNAVHGPRCSFQSREPWAVST